MKKRRSFMQLIICCISAFISQYSFAGNVPSQEHRVRENEYDLNFYFLDLNIEDSTNFISGNSMLRAHALQRLDTFSVELDTTLLVDSVIANLNGGNNLQTSYIHNGTELNILLPFTVPVGSYTEVRIYYRGNVSLYSGVSTGYNQIYSVSETYYSYSWFPCKQVLTDKADSSWFFITTNLSSRGISNGLLSKITNVSPDKQRWEWKSHHPIAYYLISFVVGQFSVDTRSYHAAGRNDSMPLQFYYQNASDTAGCEKVDKILDLYSRLFGLYPFYDEKLGFAFTELGGGMENQTAITLGATKFPRVGPHEIAHQWFGDNVTCASFKDMMINEGFATWCESIYDEFYGAGRANYFQELEVQDIADWAQGSGYIIQDTANDEAVFNHSLIYDKNAMMINSLRFVINNDSLFFLGLRNYQSELAGINAYGIDLRDIMENTTGIDLMGFFNQWYYGCGYPSFSYTWNQVDSQLMLKITETTSCSSTPFFQTPLELNLYTSTGNRVIKVAVNNPISTFNIPISGKFQYLAFDPNQWIANGMGENARYDSTLILSDIEQAILPPHFTIYPNPITNTSTINIDPSLLGASLQLTDVTGRILQTTQLKTTTYQMETSSLATGVYFLQLTAAGQRLVKELVKE